MLPTWNDVELNAYDIFVSETQDINIYVEDANSEIFYGALFDSMFANKIKINKILPLNGRNNVISYCQEYNEPHAALFIIDSDLYLCKNERMIGINRLYEHDRYCIENYLFSLDGLVEIIHETIATKTKENIKSEIPWDIILDNISNTLVKLFIEFAVISKFDAGITTVKTGIKDLFTGRENDNFTICETKVTQLIEDKKKELFDKKLDNVNEEIYASLKNNIIKNVEEIKEKIHIVSGKHYLIHILYKVFNRYAPKAQVKMDSFQLRLAKNCDKVPLEPLKNAIEKTCEGKLYCNA